MRLGWLVIASIVTSSRGSAGPNLECLHAATDQDLHPHGRRRHDRARFWERASPRTTCGSSATGPSTSSTASSASRAAAAAPEALADAAGADSERPVPSRRRSLRHRGGEVGAARCRASRSVMCAGWSSGSTRGTTTFRRSTTSFFRAAEGRRRSCMSRAPSAVEPNAWSWRSRGGSRWASGRWPISTGSPTLSSSWRERRTGSRECGAAVELARLRR